MAELWVNDSGTARQIREVWINDSGTARRINEIWVNDAGTARRIFVGDQITISDMTVPATTSSPTNATASYSLASDGDIDATAGTNTIVDRGDWISPQINMSAYEARVTVTSGALSSGTEGSWLALSSTRTWTVVHSGVGTGSTSCVFTLEIRRASDGVVLDTATISMQAIVI